MIISLSTENRLQCSLFGENEPAPKLEDWLIFMSEITSFRKTYDCFYCRFILTYQTEQNLTMIRLQPCHWVGVSFITINSKDTSLPCIVLNSLL